MVEEKLEEAGKYYAKAFSVKGVDNYSLLKSDINYINQVMKCNKYPIEIIIEKINSTRKLISEFKLDLDKEDECTNFSFCLNLNWMSFLRCLKEQINVEI